MERFGDRLRRLDDRVLGPPRPDAPDPLRRLGLFLTCFGGLHTVAWLLGLAGSSPAAATPLALGVVVLLVARRRPPGGPVKGRQPTGEE